MGWNHQRDDDDDDDIEVCSMHRSLNDATRDMRELLWLMSTSNALQHCMSTMWVIGTCPYLGRI